MVLSRAAWQEIRVRSGRDDKKEKAVVKKEPLPRDKAMVGRVDPLATAFSFSDCPSPFCHPDRSEAEGRDLRFSFRFTKALGFKRRRGFQIFLGVGEVQVSMSQ